jgi:chorismate lyase / 3-hydroxybenzoate synthase
LPPLRIGYAHAAPSSWRSDDKVLAAISFGGGPADECTDPRQLRIGLEVIGDPRVEVWRAEQPTRSGREGAVRWTSDGNYGFFSVELDEAAYGGIEHTAEQAYRQLTAVMRASATPHVLRLWNYFDAINLGDGDDERYRRFCVGRARGMAGTWRESYPAATAIGRRDGMRVLQVYALTARLAGAPVENPRQVNAWRYPRQYGPTPPTFARGMVTPAGQLLISGTAAVVGCASRHEDDVAAQVDETLTNISSLIASARPDTPSEARGSLFKVYLRERADAAQVAERLGKVLRETDDVLILNGDICRRELLVEIDGVQDQPLAN